MSFPRIATVTAAVAFACAVLPSLASAADYCVYPAQSCGPNNEMELQPALDEAAATSEADRILLGARTYFVPTGQQGFRYDATKSQVEIVGAGRGQTVLTGDPSSAGQVLTLNGAPGSSVHDLAIQIPSSVTQDFVGLRTNERGPPHRGGGGPAADPATSSACSWQGTRSSRTRAIELEHRGELRRGAAAMPPQPAGRTGIRWSVVQECGASGRAGIDSDRFLTLERSRVTARQHRDRGSERRRPIVRQREPGQPRRGSAGTVVRVQSRQRGSGRERDWRTGVTMVGAGSVEACRRPSAIGGRHRARSAGA